MLAHYESLHWQVFKGDSWVGGCDGYKAILVLQSKAYAFEIIGWWQLHYMKKPYI